MSTFVIEGGTPLTGSVLIPGNKNAVLPAMAASLLTDKEVVLENVPRIRDVDTMSKLIQGLGVVTNGVNTRGIKIRADNLKNNQPDDQLVTDLRASILLMGPLVAKFGKVTIRHPGGDIIGLRSIDEHLKAFSKLGAKITQDGLMLTLAAEKVHGARIHLSEASVTATENIMMAAVTAEGETVITNAACEPHVMCLGRMLTAMGANISGMGTNTINIIGVKSLGGCVHRIRPDHIEIGTWMIAAAATGGEITVHGAFLEDLAPMLVVLEPMGVKIEEIHCHEHHQDGVSCFKASRGKLTAYPHIHSNVWPGFPTDLMSPTIVLATQCTGTTLAHDWMYEGRMFFVDRLIKMGANIIVADPHRVIINGPTSLSARHTSSPDIRAGVALVIASIIAKGTSQIDMAEIIDRGYEQLEERLVKLGTNITRTA